MKNNRFTKSTPIDGMALAIKQSHFDAIRGINFGLLTLFWNIGKMVGSMGKDETNALPERTRMESLAANLTGQFGSLLSQDNLRIMEKFSLKCEANTRDAIAGAIGWKDIPLFLGLNSHEEWIYYATLLQQQNLSSAQLQEKIAENDYQKKPESNQVPEHTLAFSFFLFDREYRDNLRMNELLTRTGAKEFRDLFEPKNLEDYSYNKKLDAAQQDEVEIVNIVIDFQKIRNNWLNVNVIMNFIKIGESILRALQAGQSAADIAVQLQQDLGAYFNEKWVSACAEFYQQYSSDRRQAIFLAQHVYWEHIEELLALEDKGLQLYFANEVHKNGLTVLELKELIQTQFQRNDFNLPEIEAPVVKSSKRKNRNITVQATFQGIEDIQEIPGGLHQNLYENRELLSFLSSIKFST